MSRKTIKAARSLSIRDMTAPLRVVVDPALIEVEQALAEFAGCIGTVLRCVHAGWWDDAAFAWIAAESWQSKAEWILEGLEPPTMWGVA